MTDESFDQLKSKSLNELIKTFNLKSFMQTIAHESCSLIRDTKIERTIQRIEIFTHLCDDDEFLSIFVARLIKIQTQKGISNRITLKRF